LCHSKHCDFKQQFVRYLPLQSRQSASGKMASISALPGQEWNFSPPAPHQHQQTDN
jgi:hypothetical protein